MPARPLRSLLLTLGLLACSDPVPALPGPSSSSARVTVSADDLTEGPVKAFGLAMPLGAAPRRKTPTTQSFEVPATTEKTVAFLSSRLTVDRMQTSPDKTTFEGARPKASPSNRVSVVVKPLSVNSEVIVRLQPERTPTPPDDDGVREPEPPESD